MSESPEITSASSDFSDPSQTVLCDLAEIKIIQISGEDAPSFLQGQLSNDIEQVSPSKGQISAYCSPKGRTLALFTILSWKGDYLLLVSADIAESIAQRLKMFVMRAKVDVTLTDTLKSIGFCGENSFELVKQLIPATTDKVGSDDYACTSSDQLLACKIPGPFARYIMVGSQEEIAQLKDSELIRDLSAHNFDYWTWLNVLSGEPMITENVQEAFVPQMINLDLLDGISFTKGCYPGQEVVARTKYLGKIKRRMLPFEVSTADQIKAGDDIFPASEDNAQPLAKVVSALSIDQDKSVGLAVVQIEASEGKKLAIHSPQGAELTFIQLPYSLNNDESTETTA